MLNEPTKKLSKNQFLELIKKENPKANLLLISKAYEFSMNAHKGQKRVSGDPYFVHCQEVAYTLARLHMDSESVCAGLLHDVVEDTRVKQDEIRRYFGEEVSQLVEGVTKIHKLRLTEKEQAENLRKILFATAKDVRIMLIRLADRLHNMRTLRFLPNETQKKIAEETLEIYVPIAYKLGMYRMKSEMEDLCLKYLKPEVYKELKKKISKKTDEREREVKEIIKVVKEKLDSANINAEVIGRAKHFYSIHKKMEEKGKRFEDILDLSGMRIITDNVEDCYRVLGVIHSSFTAIPEGFHDYIANPKPNMYQSIHTDILVNKKPVEVQIRTLEMHHTAEEGVAAHWRYKGTERDKKFDKRISWLKEILDWRRKKDARGLIEDLKVDIFKDQIYVITPKGEPIELPEGSTPIDFAYEVHTDIGNHCVGAKVNNTFVPLDYELKPGDVVEIITDKRAKPSRSWLSIVRTSEAREKIRHTLGIKLEPKKPEEEIMVKERVIDLIESRGIKRSLLRIAKCCDIHYKDQIVGYRMKDGKVALHKQTCENLKGLDEKRKIVFSWREKEAPAIKLEVEIIDRVGLLADILNIIAQQNINIQGVKSKTAKEKLILSIEVKMPKEKIGDLIQKIKSVKNVVDVRY